MRRYSAILLEKLIVMVQCVLMYCSFQDKTLSCRISLEALSEIAFFLARKRKKLEENYYIEWIFGLIVSLEIIGMKFVFCA